MTYVVAGAQHQYERWRKDHYLPPGLYRYVSRERDLRCARPDKIIFMGTWSDRSDLDEILETVKRLERMGTEVVYK